MVLPGQRQELSGPSPVPHGLRAPPTHAISGQAGRVLAASHGRAQCGRIFRTKPLSSILAQQPCPAAWSRSSCEPASFTSPAEARGRLAGGEVIRLPLQHRERMRLQPGTEALAESPIPCDQEMTEQFQTGAGMSPDSRQEDAQHLSCAATQDRIHPRRGQAAWPSTRAGPG